MKSTSDNYLHFSPDFFYGLLLLTQLPILVSFLWKYWFREKIITHSLYPRTFPYQWKYYRFLSNCFVFFQERVYIMFAIMAVCASEPDMDFIATVLNSSLANIVNVSKKCFVH
jgi:hypothetical protein